MKKTSLLIALMASMVALAVSGSRSFVLSEFLTDGCVEPIAEVKNFPSHCFPNHESIIKELIVPERVLNWGSNGLSGKPWQFADAQCNEFYSGLYTAITQSLPDIRLDPFDLFHAHLMGYGEHHDRLLMMFHAKEYPADIEEIKNYYQAQEERFFQDSPSFEKRNFIYLSHDGENKIYMVHQQGLCEQFFSDEGVNQLSDEKIMNQFSEAQRLGDVNIFLPNNLKKINYAFYSGTDKFSGAYSSDLEGLHTGKTVVERIHSNFSVHQWLSSFSTPIVYFLTGYHGMAFITLTRSHSLPYL